MADLNLNRNTFGDEKNKGNLLTREVAFSLLDEWVKNDRLKLHMFQVGGLMKAWAIDKEEADALLSWKWEMSDSEIDDDECGPDCDDSDVELTEEGIKVIVGDTNPTQTKKRNTELFSKESAGNIAPISSSQSASAIVGIQPVVLGM